MTDTPTTAVTGHHLPALNGLRALAVLGVMAYHLQLGWASGGYLGVDLFFVLSGFLISTLLLEEWLATGAVSLANFWGRRAKRLLPALFLVVAALGVYLVVNAHLGGPGANGLVDLSALRGDALATLLYVGNWHAIYAHQSYFAQFSTPSPLQHTWSLAIEEQFYLVWPPALLLLVRSARRSWRQVGTLVVTGVGLLSAGLMAFLFHPGGDPTRVYYGTDTRLFDLMAGATVAFLAAGRPQPGLKARRVLHMAAPASAALLGVFWVISGTSAGLPKDFMFQGGFLLCAVLAAVVVADVRLLDPGPLSRLLSVRPLHFLGHHLLRDLPVALADLRLPDWRRYRSLDRATGRGPHRPHPRGGHSQLLPGRTAPPPSPPPWCFPFGAGANCWCRRRRPSCGGHHTGDR